jgi:hypothetical protein
MFQLSLEEKRKVVANCDHLSKLKYSATLPNAFTEYGAIMAANVLNPQRALGACPGNGSRHVSSGERRDRAHYSDRLLETTIYMVGVVRSIP